MTNFEATLREAITRASEEDRDYLIVYREGPFWKMFPDTRDFWPETTGFITFQVTPEGLVPVDVMKEMNMFDVPGEQDWELERTRYLLKEDTIDVYPNEVIVNGQSF